MSKLARLMSLASVAVLALAGTAMAQDGGEAATQGATALIDFSKYFGVGLTVVGAGFAIARLASAALEGMARQPEAAGNIQTAMIIAAALIEGFTFFALFICMS